MTVEDWAEIRRLHRVEGVAIKAIARRLGVSRNAVRRALARDVPPKYVRAPKGSIVDAVEPAIRELLREHPRMPATVIAERVGWERSLTVLKDRVRELRERAIRMAVDSGRDLATRKGVLARVGEQLGINPETLRNGVAQAEVDAGDRPSTTTSDAQRLAELERENRELRRANAIPCSRPGLSVTAAPGRASTTSRSLSRSTSTG